MFGLFSKSLKGCAFLFWAVALSVTPSLAKDEVVPSNEQQIRYSYAPLVKKLSHAVVNVYAARQVKQRTSPFAGDPFFEQFFGRRMFGGRSRNRTERSLGSGVIIGSDGIVITNNHVINGADEVKVALVDGREFSAEIKLIDKKSDLAVLKINTDEVLPAVSLGDSEELEVGDLVLAIGNPFGVGQTVTSGIVSALARSQGGVNDFGFFIQTDASINPGNSGGALVNMDGKLIGINTAIFTKSGGSNGIGFAVPSNMVRVVLDSVRKGSRSILRPWIGATFQPVTSDIAESLGLDRPRGALVAGILRGSPAEKAGLNLGDVILQLDGKPVPHSDALGYRLATAGIGRAVVVSVLARGKMRDLQLELIAAPETPPRDQRKIKGRTPFSGLTVVNISPRIAQELELVDVQEGVAIVGVDPRSPAARFGFKMKDVIIELNDQAVVTTRQLEKALSRRQRGWKYVLERNGRLFKQYIR